MMKQQKIIADWLRSIRYKMGISWAELARKADIKAATTLSRAVDRNYSSIMSVRNLEAIAQAAEIPSILDFLTYQNKVTCSEEADIIMITTILEKYGPRNGWQGNDVRQLASILIQHLSLYK
ncbi:MAG: XRE family transcriptional regulator [Zymomonas mobilis subsp. pomaceae]|uniref:XRE family transcriptional regulator n=1 Tax=Zymomonas mobilis TaxID=542 RepID=UPI0039ECE9C0